MRKLLQILVFSASFAVPCFSQMSQPKGEWQIYGGYSFMRANVREYYKASPIVYALRTRDTNLNGWDLSITENVKRWFGGTLDASGHYGSPVLVGATTNERAYSILYGPRFFHQGRHFIPFAHVLAGMTHVSAAVTPTGPNVSANSLAIVPGFGLDWRIFSHASIRVLQLEYFHTNLQGGSQNQFRAAAGMVFDLNSK